MINTSGFINAFMFVLEWLIGRACFSWLIRLSYASAGETMRSAEKHNDQVKRKLIPYEREIDWLAKVSNRPVTTKIIYIMFYVFTSLPLLGLCLSVVSLFVPGLDDFLSKAGFVLIILDFASIFANLLLRDPIVYFMEKKDKKIKDNEDKKYDL